MTARSRNAVILSGQTAPELNRELSFILQRMSDRLDRIEGLRGTATIESDLVMSSQRVREVAPASVSTEAPNYSQITADVASEIAAHTAAANPHPGYVLPGEAESFSFFQGE